ncbi:hypothetical protein VUR80DRAFT_300 [Thermomyces stellatus]
MGQTERGLYGLEARCRGPWRCQGSNRQETPSQWSVISKKDLGRGDIFCVWIRGRQQSATSEYVVSHVGKMRLFASPRGAVSARSPRPALPGVLGILRILGVNPV